MARIFLNDIKTDILNLFPDNITQEIDPVDLRSVLDDVIDSTVEGISLLGLSATLPNVNLLNNQWVQLGPVFDVFLGDDTLIEGFLKIDEVAGTVTTSSTAGFVYKIKGAIAFDGNRNTLYELALFIDGAPNRLIDSAIGDTGNNILPIGMSTQAALLPATPNQVCALAIRANQNETIDISDLLLNVQILPTKGP